MKEKPEILIPKLHEAWTNMLSMYQCRRQALNENYPGISVERNRHLLDELDRDIRIAISRISRFKLKNDWSPEASNQLIKELRTRNSECDRKIRQLAAIFPT